MLKLLIQGYAAKLLRRINLLRKGSVEIVINLLKLIRCFNVAQNNQIYWGSNPKNLWPPGSHHFATFWSLSVISFAHRWEDCWHHEIKQVLPSFEKNSVNIPLVSGSLCVTGWTDKECLRCFIVARNCSNIQGSNTSDLLAHWVLYVESAKDSWTPAFFTVLDFIPYHRTFSSFTNHDRLIYKHIWKL